MNRKGLTNRPQWTALATLLVALGVMVLGVQCKRGRPEYHGPARHVIFISLDTTRADHFGCYGNDWIQTPRIDALAAESILFENYMTVVPTTLASHTSLFTGNYPHTHGVARNGFMVHEDNVMLPEILREAGFHTAGFIGAFVLDSRFGFAQGFEDYDENIDQMTYFYGDYKEQRPAETVTGAVIRYLDEKGVPENLFLFVHYFDPHTPYEPPAPYDTLYDPQGRDNAPDATVVIKQCFQQPGVENPDAKRMAQQYAGEISYLDEHVGRLLDDLAKRGILDEAIVVVTSDHGENLWEHWYPFDHGTYTYQTTVQGICLIRMPGAKHAGTRVDGLVASIDILPSVLDYLGLPIPAGIDGKALDLAGGGAPRKQGSRFCEASKPWTEEQEPPLWYNGRKVRCVRSGDLKYILNPYAGIEELYDLSTDPLERNNLLFLATAEALAKAKPLKMELEAWAASANPLPSRFNPEQNQETIEKLQALGYLKP